MKKIGIKGGTTVLEGQFVIKILEHLGGINSNHMFGTCSEYYYIDENNIIRITDNPYNLNILTLQDAIDTYNIIITKK